MPRTEYELPKRLDGVEVQGDDIKPLETSGGLWRTLIPVDETDERIWEFDVWTGRVIETTTT